MTTDETAKTILDGDWTIICEAIDTPDKVADLQAMAKLWLMRDEITETVKQFEGVAIYDDRECAWEDYEDSDLRWRVCETHNTEEKVGVDRCFFGKFIDGVKDIVASRGVFGKGESLFDRLAALEEK